MMSSIRRKADAKEITDFIRRLPERLGLEAGRRSWPEFLFHTTDMENALTILQTGTPHCRNRATQMGLLSHDAASQSVLDHTSERIQDLVRFYFRPRTPTHYRTEGIRPITGSDSFSEPRMPLPVVFVFHAANLMTREGTIFFDRNAGSSTHRSGDDCRFLETIPFEDVYHDGPLPTDRKAMITSRRNAEVGVPDHLQLDDALNPDYS